MFLFLTNVVLINTFSKKWMDASGVDPKGDVVLVQQVIRQYHAMLAT